MRGAFAKLGRCRQFQHPASSPQPPESNREPRRFVRARLQSCRGRRKFLPALAAEAMFLRLSCRVLIPHPLSPRQNPKISNREAQRLETLATQTKQRTQPRSNREKAEVFALSLPPMGPAKPPNSNRETILLETYANS